MARRFDRIRRRLREERGFTLMELMVASIVGTVIMLVAYGLLDSTIRAFGSSEQRTDVAQRGRVAVDAVTQRLRSPVCLEDLGTSSVISADASGITFWSDTTGSNFRAGNPDPVVRELRVAGGVLTERVRATPGGLVTQQRELATGVTQVGTTPFFAYSALSPATTPPRQASVALTVPVPAADLARVARITVSFQIEPRSTDNAKSAAQFVSNVYLRSIDYSSAQGVIRCTAR
jgi:prepilin-type N-terminal cleavage/methylation domain-containing protein